jgi:hypothetical protein
MAKEVVMVPKEKYRKLMENYEKEMNNPIDKDRTRKEEGINLTFADVKNEGSDDENKRCIEENKVRLNSFEDNDLNSQLNAKQLKRERPDLDVISPSNEMTDEIASSKQRESKTLPDIDPDFGVYKSISAITKDHKRSEKRRKMAKIRWLKPI